MMYVLHCCDDFRVNYFCFFFLAVMVHDYCLSQMSVASSIATTKIEKLLLRLSRQSAASEGNAAGAKRLKLQLNRKYNSLYPVLEVEEEST